MSIVEAFKTIPVIVEGSIKVVREDNAVNELFLYFLQRGPTCAMLVNCSMVSKPMELRATAEEDTVLIAISGETAAKWMSELPE